jgi:hypothetical protein
MATSRSSDPKYACTATALIFSGRRDPQWRVPVEAARGLKQLWEQLERFAGTPPQAPALGYRGSVLDCGDDGRWVAYGDVVETARSYRHDPERRFERALLGSAPKDLIPPDILRKVLE